MTTRNLATSSSDRSCGGLLAFACACLAASAATGCDGGGTSLTGDADGPRDAVDDVDAEVDPCVAACASRECGPNPDCDGTCGPGCGAIEACTENGHCVPVDGDWVEAPPGTFAMGVRPGEPGSTGTERHTSQRIVTLTRGFVVLATEVTQAEFAARMGYNPSSHLGCDTCPVEEVSWHAAAEYCNALSAAAGRPSCYECVPVPILPPHEYIPVACVPSTAFATPYDCPGYRIPTTAEWEYAARAGTTTSTYNGDLDLDHMGCEQPNPVADPIAWFCGNTPLSPDGTSESQPVAGLAPNPWGLYDVLGNVFEWTHDLWYEVAGPSTHLTDPVGPPDFLDTDCMRAGGAYSEQAGHLLVAGRIAGIYGMYGMPDTGFRPVRTLP